MVFFGLRKSTNNRFYHK